MIESTRLLDRDLDQDRDRDEKKADSCEPRDLDRDFNTALVNLEIEIGIFELLSLVSRSRSRF